MFIDTTVTVEVPADADQDDCLNAAAAEFISERAELQEYHPSVLVPAWTDDSDRETVTLILPSGYVRPIRELREEAAQHGDDRQVELCDAALGQSEGYHTAREQVAALDDCYRAIRRARAVAEVVS